MTSAGASAGGAAKPVDGVVLVPQSHGGALYSGGVPGNPGNRSPMGVLPSIVREACRGDFYARRRILCEIADGKTRQRVRVSLYRVLMHAKCPECTAPLVPAQGKGLGVEIPGYATPTAADRVRAIDVLGRYGMTADRALGLVDPDVKHRLTETLTLVLSRESWPSGELITALEGIWR